MITKEINNFDISFGTISDYKAQQVPDVKIREYKLCQYHDLHIHFLLVAEDGTVVGEFSFADDTEFGGVYEHTAHLHKSLRGQGLYLEVLQAVRLILAQDIHSYPFDPDSEQERSEMNNRFWRKNGKRIGSDGGPIYKLK